MILNGVELSPLLQRATFAPTPPGAASVGIQVVGVQAGSSAAQAGLRKGDVIIALNQEAVSRLEDFAAKVKGSPIRLLLNLLRNGGSLFIVLQA